MSETVLVLDFGSQYTQLIARRIREQRVYSVVYPFDTSVEKIRALAPRAIVLSGGPQSVYAEAAPICSREVFELGVPILGICYGMQLTAYLLDGTVEASSEREYGRAEIDVSAGDSPLFTGTPAHQRVWASHGDKILRRKREVRRIERPKSDDWRTRCVDLLNHRCRISNESNIEIGRA